MSKPVNFLDLIKNPDKIQNKQPIKGSNSNTTTPKEAVIPPNLAGAQKNEWLEQQQKKNSQNANKKDDDVQILDYNPFKNNQEAKDSLKKQIQKPNIQQAAPPKNISEGNKINNTYQIISKPNQLQQANSPQQQINKNNVVNIGGDQLVFRQTQNNKQDKNAIQPTEISKKNSIQFNSDSSNSSKNNNIINQNNKANQQISSNTNTHNTNNKIVSNNQRVQSNKSVGSIFSSNKSNTSNKSAGMSKQEMLKAKYSLVNQSKEDYKKIFSKIVKEYSDTENLTYNPSKINYSLYFIYFCVFVFFVMVSLDYVASNTPKFCKNEVKYDTPKCIVCPENAQCKNYVMKCNDGFIQEGYKCKLNPNLISSSESFIIEKITQIQYDNGHRMCFAQESDIDQKQKEEEEVIKISRAQLLEELQQRLADKKAVAQQKKILEKFLVSTENQEKLGFKYDQESQTLTSSRLRFTIFCKCKQLIKNNQKSIAISSLTLVSLIIVGIILKKHFKKIRIANEIYEELAHQIQETSDKQINVSYYKEGIVNRFKSDFNEDVWILVDRKRVNEQKINVYRDCDGLYWSQI
ncbi:Man1-Src1p-carboxy-terminal domain protein (macronuclear) [Tetrahymena thermophila SB210]|uniref:Man1-Src1p-carboxy-terminal domain protein n=1 Tax=Tetrahymena thermophila (strain SB210) TaxID=312017 RepID=I7M722_TETTS|nr:Man1-Src1p-carboxy-terminal domain protein [Tetrahymena thermophila SB210]EAR87708.1 Man1-Src1p-carboxy-terminal domain protein [Tetrahymena thermophila SB210]|eukprot:XP_001007953.1 Man1-Src1p-carboxy-terminal domain protein [Tetrahymena thermophila SB210]